MTLDWDGDPELKAIRDDFVKSLSDRSEILRVALSQLADDAPGALRDIQQVAHKLAGTAASYGFPTLTRIGEMIDDRLDEIFSSNRGMTALNEEATRAQGYVAVLEAALREGAAGRDDTGALDAPALKSLTSGA
ncbi:MAG: Hpt domain-containing protein [Bdellovibrionales bacterium]|nr:Hpt domain-containing protein [Bdellovibrionales bacterium]